MPQRTIRLDSHAAVIKLIHESHKEREAREKFIFKLIYISFAVAAITICAVAIA